MFEANVIETGDYVRLSGQLTFSEQARFRDICNQLLRGGADRMTLDFADVDFIDSAGLAMLLLLREEAKRGGRTLRLEKARGQVCRMFELSRFSSLFELAN